MKTIRFIFRDDMARAIVQGRKTVTRRPVVPATWNPSGPEYTGDSTVIASSDPRIGTQAYFRTHEAEWHGTKLPCLPGDLLIGRECWRAFGGISDVRVDYRAGGRMVIGRESETVAGAHVHYLPDASKYEASGNKWRPSIHMPDWAARIRRRVVSVTVERVQDITEDDAVREGFVPREPSPPVLRHHSARDLFSSAWDSIYAAKGLGWDANPWVWRIEFGAESVEGEK